MRTAAAALVVAGLFLAGAVANLGGQPATGPAPAPVLLRGAAPSTPLQTRNGPPEVEEVARQVEEEPVEAYEDAGPNQQGPSGGGPVDDDGGVDDNSGPGSDSSGPGSSDGS